MTTMAWDGKTLAVDSRLTIGQDILDDKRQKLFRDVGIFSAVALCGSYDEAKAYVEDILSIINSPLDLMDTEASTEHSVLGILKETQEAWRLNGNSTYKLDTSWAYGSGADYAIGAMDHGDTAPQAVRYASTRDIYSNSRVQSYTVKSVKPKETK